MKKRVFIVDDEELAIDEMKFLLSEYNDIEICGTSSDAYEAIELVNKANPDILFLDIQLGDINAFSILEDFTSSMKIVFVTAYDEFASRAFEINALDYLLKPINPDRLKDSINRFNSNIISDQSEPIQYRYSDKIIISERNEYKLITISEITYINSDDDYTVIHLRNGTKKLLLRTMRDWEELLPPDNFMRIHRSTIINIGCIHRIEKSFNNSCKVYLSGVPEHLKMSQRYTTKFLSKYKA